jgi:hypothetical protein
VYRFTSSLSVNGQPSILLLNWNESKWEFLWGKSSNGIIGNLVLSCLINMFLNAEYVMLDVN